LACRAGVKRGGSDFGPHQQPVENDDVNEIRLGTRKPGTMSQGRVVMTALVGGLTNV
jgi:hypothetical protein